MKSLTSRINSSSSLRKDDQTATGGGRIFIWIIVLSKELAESYAAEGATIFVLINCLLTGIDNLK